MCHHSRSDGFDNRWRGFLVRDVDHPGWQCASRIGVNKVGDMGAFALVNRL